MGNYLVTYEYSYSEKKSKFTTIVEAESFKDAEYVFKDHNQSVTILKIEPLYERKQECTPTQILTRALAEAKVTELEAYLLIQQIFEHAKQMSKLKIRLPYEENPHC